MHHAQRKSLAKLGVRDNDITSNDDGSITLTHGGGKIEATDGKALIEALKVAIKDGSFKPVRRVNSGVLPEAKYIEYRAKGGGSRDKLDNAMRRAFLVLNDKDESVLDVKALRAFGKSLGLWNAEWEAQTPKRAPLNPGMLRMNLANKVRAFVRQGNDVTIGDVTIKGD
jgi:hypothetical protein